jgi:hypothetical protein
MDPVHNPSSCPYPKIEKTCQENERKRPNPPRQFVKMTQNHASLRTARKLRPHPIRLFRNLAHRSSPPRTSESIIMNAGYGAQSADCLACDWLWLAESGRQARVLGADVIADAPPKKRPG